MAEKSRTKLLEVSVFERGPKSWEWRMHSGEDVHVCGFETVSPRCPVRRIRRAASDEGWRMIEI